MIDFAHEPQDPTEAPRPLTWDYAVRFRNKEPYLRDLALVTCGMGHTTRLVSTVHQVAPDGTVTPSYVCTVTGCTFHEWVRLAGWDPNHVWVTEAP